MKAMTIKGNYNIKVAEIVVKRASQSRFNTLIDSVNLIDSEYDGFKSGIIKSKYSSNSYYNKVYIVAQFYFDYVFDKVDRNKDFKLFTTLLESYKEI